MSSDNFWCTIRLTFSDSHQHWGSWMIEKAMDEVELIKEKINIVDLISEYLPLKKTGVNFKANCPFHQEKTPSFVVSPERQIWRCFGCSRGGDIFTFLEEKEGIDFKEALEILAGKAGVTLKKRKDGEGRGINDKLYELNQNAAQYFSYILLSHPLGKIALEYLKKRGLKEETIKEFQLGYAPNNWENLTNYLKKKGYSEKELIISGLAVPSKKGGYDRFRGRIIFPLIDVRGRILGFSGRVLDSSLPKYINTPQTPIFDKGKFLFGLHLSKGAIREEKSAILVEGEMDMLMSYQTGVKNIVATKGTALTEYQIEALKKYTNTLNLCFDTDLAGDDAARRGIEMAEKENFNILVISIESGKDPGELCLNSPSEWKKAASSASPIYDYYLESVGKRLDLKSPYGKKEAFSYLLPIWKKIYDPIVADHYIQKLANLCQVKEDFVREELKKLDNTSSWREQVPAPLKQEEVYDRRKILEEYLICLILHLPINHTYVPNFPETLFTTENLRQIYVLLVLFLDNISFKAQSFKIGEFIKGLSPQLLDTVDRLYLISLDPSLEDPKHWQKEMDGVIAELKKMLIKSSLEKLSLEIKNAQEIDKMETLELLNKRFRDLSIKLKNL